MLNSVRVEQMLLVYEEEVIKSQNEYDSLLRKLECTWYTLEDTELEERIKECLQELKQNKYKISEYTRVIPLLLRLEKIDFQKNI